FQEAGRAGRDGVKAFAVLLYAKTDKSTLNKRIRDTFPDKEYIKRVYESLQYYYQMALGHGLGCVFEFNLEEFCTRFKYFPVPANSALQILTQAGYIEYTDEQDSTSRVMFRLRRDELYRIKEMNHNSDLIIQTLLRSYTGLFSDYTYIQEDSIATKTNLSHNEIYNTLIYLSKRGIIDYIPRKRTPYIIYARERVDAKNIFISKTIYEERKKRYEERINTMIYYATTDDICRSRLLLNYFGEQNNTDCKQCDVCISRKGKPSISNQEFTQIYSMVKEAIKEKPISPYLLAEKLSMEKEKLLPIIRYLIAEDQIEFKDGMLSIME
ncbi:MAG: RecQ family ATP-dependent DNA helicase, partial [Bacteroidales bacterium]|nr:RecQ family ATP-dependent DNA helicase [Bacteroidales bacterium]